MTKKTGRKWVVGECEKCGESHIGYSGKLDKDGVEYVICGKTNDRMDVTGLMIEEKPLCNLTGSSDNAFSIVAKVSKSLRRAGASEERIKEYKDKVKSGDYDNLLEVSGKYVDIC